MIKKLTFILRCYLPLALYCVLFLFSSCLKEEDPVKMPDLQGDVEMNQIPMGWSYEKQFFFDLGTNEIVSFNNKTDWDLAFQCGLNGHRVILNTSKFMFAWNTNSTDFSQITSADNAVWSWDAASGNLDSTAIGDWGNYADGNVISFGKVYLIHLGKDINNNSNGIKKMKLEGLNDNTYALRYANLDGSAEDSFRIRKDNDHNFVYFSFSDGGKKVSIAPEKDSWDLLFTQYTFIFDEGASTPQPTDTLTPYLVTGVLQNHNGVAVAKDYSTPFGDITLETAMNLPFEEAIDVIGYDWKYFNFNQVVYTVLPNRNYIIRDTEGFLYKLRFIDFYSITGEKGFPKFEFQRL